MASLAWWVDRRFAFGDEDHAEFIRFMRQYEKFRQVKVLNDFLMSNHFHFLVEVPLRPAESLSEESLCQRVRSCFGDATAEDLRWLLAPYCRQQNEDESPEGMSQWC